MTVDEVTRLLCCHRITVLRLIRRGRLHAVRIGTALRFERAEVGALNNHNIAMYPHLTIIGRRRAGLKAILKPPRVTMS
jgi:excisionase family DNA binding protein